MRALDRALAILEAVAASDEGVTMTAVASRTGMNLATVSRLMREMGASDLLTRSDLTRMYRLGPRLIWLAQTSTRRGTLVEVALPIMQELRDASAETASLQVRVGDRRVCVAAIESPQEVRRVVAVGFSLSLAAGATGQAFLANLPSAEQAAYLDTLAQNEREALVSRLVEIRTSGYAWAVNATIPGVSGIAAPIMDFGSAVAVLSVSGPSFRWTEEPMRAFAPTLVAAAQHVSRIISARHEPLVPLELRGMSDRP